MTKSLEKAVKATWINSLRGGLTYDFSKNPVLRLPRTRSTKELKENFAIDANATMRPIENDVFEYRQVVDCKYTKDRKKITRTRIMCGEIVVEKHIS